MFTAMTPGAGRKSRDRLVLGPFPPILRGPNESEPPLTRKFAFVLLSRLLLALLLAGATQAVAAEARDKTVQAEPAKSVQGTPAAVPVPPPSPLSRSSIVPASATSPEEPATTDFSSRLDAAKQSLDQIDALLAGKKPPEAVTKQFGCTIKYEDEK